MTNKNWTIQTMAIFQQPFSSLYSTPDDQHWLKEVTAQESPFSSYTQAQAPGTRPLPTMMPKRKVSSCEGAAKEEPTRSALSPASPQLLSLLPLLCLTGGPPKEMISWLK
ncbi:hypothetical protein GH733_002495 [Mirounga leonina]|nr:hypothetical protein GH733_002495 [Mirounga leonina]